MLLLLLKFHYMQLHYAFRANGATNNRISRWSCFYKILIITNNNFFVEKRIICIVYIHDQENWNNAFKYDRAAIKTNAPFIRTLLIFSGSLNYN